MRDGRRRTTDDGAADRAAWKGFAGNEMIKLLVLLIALTMSFGLAAGVTISLKPAYADNVQAKGY